MTNNLDKIVEMLDENGRFTLEQGVSSPQAYSIALKAVEDGYLTFVSIPGMASFAITKKFSEAPKNDYLEKLA